MRLSRFLIALARLAAGLAGAVLGWSPASTAQTAASVQVQRGKQVYAQYCAHCHGAEGKGDGLSGQALPIKPQNLTEGRVLNPLPDHMLGPRRQL